MKALVLPFARLTITEYQVMQAAALWSAGLGTLDIAVKLKVHESAVYNRLNLIRGAS